MQSCALTNAFSFKNIILFLNIENKKLYYYTNQTNNEIITNVY